MPTFRGSCHCGRIPFEVDARPTVLSECNCTLCRRKGALYVKVTEVDALRILSGESHLSGSQFGSHPAKHCFCRVCGIHPFHRPCIAPERWSVSTRRLEDFDLSACPHTPFDGLDWERAARAEGWTG